MLLKNPYPEDVTRSTQFISSFVSLFIYSFKCIYWENTLIWAFVDVDDYRNIWEPGILPRNFSRGKIVPPCAHQIKMHALSLTLGPEGNCSVRPANVSVSCSDPPGNMPVLWTLSHCVLLAGNLVLLSRIAVQKWRESWCVSLSLLLAASVVLNVWESG